MTGRRKDGKGSLNATFRLSVLPSAHPRLVPHDPPRPHHVLARGLPLTDRHPDGESSGEGGVGEEHRAAGVDAREQLAVELVEALAVGRADGTVTEADQSKWRWRHHLELVVALDPAPELGGERDVLPEDCLEPGDAVGADHEPELQSAESAAELD